jgi:flagellar FliL protein
MTIISMAMFLFFSCSRKNAITDPLVQAYSVKHNWYSYYMDIGPITTKTMDEQNRIFTVIMFFAFDRNDTVTSSELSSRQIELREFVKLHLSTKYAEEFYPINEMKLKNELMEIINTLFLNTGKIKRVFFKDIIEAY